MFSKFEKLLELYGPITAYLYLKSEGKSLSLEDYCLAKETAEDSTVIRVVAGALEDPPDLAFLASEALRAAAYDGEWEYQP